MDPELVQYLDERFHGLVHGLDQRFEGIDRRFDGVDRKFDGIGHRFEGINQRFDDIDRRFDEVNDRIDEVKRHSGVLVEGLRHEVHLLAEGLDTFINVRYAQDQANIAEQFRETRALIHLSYDQLRQRVENLERNRPT